MEAAGSWMMTASLPAPGSGLRAALVENSLLVFGEWFSCPTTWLLFQCLISGGYDGERVSDSILRFNPAEEAWEQVGRMREARIFHAVATLDDVSQLCP